MAGSTWPAVATWHWWQVGLLGSDLGLSIGEAACVELAQVHLECRSSAEGDSEVP